MDYACLFSTTHSGTVRVGMKAEKAANTGGY